MCPTLLLLLLMLEPCDGLELTHRRRLPAAAARPGAGGLVPSGTLLWSNFSEAGMGQDFSSALPLPGGDVLLAVPQCTAARTCGMQLGRLRPSTGALMWSASPPADGGPWSLALGGAASAPIAILSRGLSFSSSGSPAVRAYETDSGQLMWKQDHLPFNEPPGPLAVSRTTLLVTGALSVRGIELGVRAIALSLTDGSVLLNRSVAHDNTTFSICNGYSEKTACQRHGCAWSLYLGQCDRIDWFALSAALVSDDLAAPTAEAAVSSGSGSGSGSDFALIGIDDAEVSGAAGMIVAMGFTDHRPRWTARNVSAARLYIAKDVSVLIAAVDTRPFFGRESTVLMLRGFALADGRLLWQRMAAAAAPSHGHADDPGPAIGVPLARACDVDCSLPCRPGLVAAGAFGAIDAQTGRTVYASNTTGKVLPYAVANGIAYYIRQPQIGRVAEAGRSGQGTLMAMACSSGIVLWSALLPVGATGGAAPYQKIIVAPDATASTTAAAAAAAATTAATALPRAVAATAAADRAVVLVGGHEQGQCFRGHCAPSYSAIAAFSGPHAPNPPTPPAPPSQCEEEMEKDCATAKTSSAAKCEVCCGEHASDLQKVGCVERDFEAFCSTLPHHASPPTWPPGPALPPRVLV
jgi:hypothetical protein